jgi:hypothetical protein
MKKCAPHYWLVQAFRRPDKQIFASTERDAKEVAGYKGFRGVSARPIRCQAPCHEYVTNAARRWAQPADRKGSAEQLVCRACDEHLRRDPEARIREVEKAVVELRAEVRGLWEDR